MKTLLLCGDTEADRVVPLCQRHGVGIEVQAFYDPPVIGQTSAVPEHERVMASAKHGDEHGVVTS